MSRELLKIVGLRLQGLETRTVYVGGAVLELLVTDTAAAPIRPTDDVDVVVEVISRIEYSTSFRDRVIELGFKEDMREGAPLCRWIVDGVTVDLMPSEGDVLGFRNRWYPLALARATRTDVDGIELNVVDAASFVGSKLEAFFDRGNGDYQSSHDLEDIITVIDGRATIVAEIAGAPLELREYVATEVGRLLGSELFIDALPGHLPGDAASQARAALVISRLREIAAMAG